MGAATGILYPIERIRTLFLFTCVIILHVARASAQPAHRGDSTACKIVPRIFSLQYAGSVGFLSVGMHYPMFREKLLLGFSYGYVPRSLGGELHIAATRLLYRPFVIKHENLRFYPVNPVFFLSYTFGSDFHLTWPKNQYPDDYYWWSSALRIHGGFNSEVELKLEDKSIKALAFYIECNTNDLYFLSYLSNTDYLSPQDIIKWGTGLRARF